MRVTFPSGRSADELCPVDAAHLVWAVNLGCLDLNPWPVRRDDVDHPDELRVDLDPQPGVPFDAVREVAGAVHEVLEAHALVGFPKTSGSRGMHVNVRVEPRWDFTEVRRARARACCGARSTGAGDVKGWDSAITSAARDGRARRRAVAAEFPEGEGGAEASGAQPGPKEDVMKETS